MPHCSSLACCLDLVGQTGQLRVLAAAGGGVAGVREMATLASVQFACLLLWSCRTDRAAALACRMGGGVVRSPGVDSAPTKGSKESELLSHGLVCGGSPRGTSGDDSGGSGWTAAGSVLRLGYGQGQESELLSHCLVCGGSPRGTSGDDSGGSGWTTAGPVLRLGYGQGRVLNSFGMTIPASRRLCQCRVSVGG